MGEVHSEICELFDYLCGEESESSQNEIKSQLMSTNDNKNNPIHTIAANGPTDYPAPTIHMTEEKSSNETHSYYHQINDKQDPTLTERSGIVSQIEIQCDHYITAMLHAKIQEITNQNTASTHHEYPLCRVPTPYRVLGGDPKTERISCCPFQQNPMYQLPAIDEYFGDLCAVHKYDKLNRYLINKRMSPRPVDAQMIKQYMTQNIYTRLFEVNSTLQSRYNQWKKVDLESLTNAKQYVHNMSDLWLTLIAFSGFAAHRLKHMSGDNMSSDVSFISDVSFLSTYPVRDEYVKYGAIACFDQNYCISKIFVSHLDEWVTPHGRHSAEEWEHAKWVWKVSVTVVTFLVDMISHCRFRESASLIKAMHQHLGHNHPVRRLLIPFTYGTVYANCMYNEHLKKNGLFHRVFAFTYDGLSKLIKDSMADAPPRREPRDDMKYRWKFTRKKACPVKKNSDLDLKTFSPYYPLYADVLSFWDDTLEFVAAYIASYYNDNDKDDHMLTGDKELVDFYDALLTYSGITTKFKLSKFNITNTLTQFICNGSIWNRYLSGAVSFQYVVDPAFVGLKIDKTAHINSNSTQNYIEYVCAVLSSGWNLMHCQGYNVLHATNRRNQDIKWKHVLLDDSKKKKNGKVFDKYFNKISKRKNGKNQTMVPYITGNRQCLSTSIMV
eukprot:296154_1